MHLKHIVTLILSVILLTLLSSQAFAMNSGCTTTPRGQEEIETYVKNFQFSFFKTEPSQTNVVNCFDVNEDGWIAVGLSDFYSTWDNVCVYSQDGTFQYGYKFNDPGAFYVEWDGMYVIIHSVRGESAIKTSSDGTFLEVADVPITPENNKYRTKYLSQQTRKFNNTTYVVESDLGFLDIFLFEKSQIVIIPDGEEPWILYDSTHALMKHAILRIILIVVPLGIGAYCTVKAYKKRKNGFFKIDSK